MVNIQIKLYVKWIVFSCTYDSSDDIMRENITNRILSQYNLQTLLV
jgi:hypothetical protein